MTGTIRIGGGRAFPTRSLRRGAERALLPLLLVAAWQASVSFSLVPHTLIAPPGEVIADLFRLALSGVLVEHVTASVGRLLTGFATGAAAGVLAGSWMGVSRSAQRFLGPTVSMLAPIPPTAWIPLLIILFGIHEASKVWLIAIGVFFVVTANTVSGIRHVDRRLVEVARIHDKTGPEILLQVLLPAAMPAILTGLRLGLGLGWILLVAAEIITADKGIGWFIYDARNFARPDDMLAGMVCIGILGAGSDLFMTTLQRRVLRWQDAFTGH